MELGQVQEDYLEAVYVLREKNGPGEMCPYRRVYGAFKAYHPDCCESSGRKRIHYEQSPQPAPYRKRRGAGKTGT